MWPPSSDDSLLARRMIATAFQRMAERMLVLERRGRPATSLRAPGAIVFTYGVVAMNGGMSAALPRLVAQLPQQERARSAPCVMR